MQSRTLTQISVLFFFLVSGLTTSLVAQTDCENDQAAPTALCIEGLAVRLFEGLGTAEVFAPDLDNGSFDDCTANPELRISRTGSDTPPPANSISLILTQADLGTITAVLWVGDQAGNWNRCFSTISVNVPTCNEDTSPPTAICDSEVRLALNEAGVATLQASDLDENSFDLCTPTDKLRRTVTTDVNATEPAMTTSIELPQGEHTVVLWIGDEAGNWNRCFSTVFVGDKCLEDTKKPTVICIVGLQANLDSGTENKIFARDFDGGSTDDCTTPELLEFRIEKGKTNGTPPTSISIDIDQSDVGTQLVTVWAGDQAGNWDYCETTLVINNFSTQFITGKVYQELNGNCQRDEDEPGLPSKTVMARGKNSQKTYTSFTDSFGNYAIPVNSNTEAEEYEIKVISDLDYSQNCPAIYTLNQLKAGDNTLDIPFVVNADCNEVLGVNIGTPALEICANNTYYVNYCNFGAEAAEVAIIEVELDPFLEIRSASIPYTTGENNTLIFFLENLAPAKCDTSFSFTAFLSCDAVEGQTHLVDATIFSDQPCENDNPLWSGASIKVTGECEEDQIKMNIQNIGTGDMLEPLQYVIVEDVLLLRSEKFKLNQGQGINFNFAANGSTWRLEAEQEGNHPGQSMPSVTVEGCSGINTTGLVGLFPQDDADLNRAIDYQQNTNEPTAPNNLSAFPKGYGAAHFIEQNVPIQYVVDFLPEAGSEPTTATIEMKLSPYLDINSIQTGVSNLPYTFEKTETSIRFLFKDISPLSAEQRGFIKFKISQKTDNPRNSLIENQAAITFDENTPTMTRVVFHTVDADYLELTASTSVIDEAGGQLTVYPNPTTDRLHVQLADYSLTKGRFNLLTVSGQRLQSHVFQDNQLTIEQLNLAAGLYFYQIESEGKPVHYGKLVVR